MKKRVLIVEDDETFANYNKKYLSENFIVDVAFNGGEALLSAERNSYDCILMDIALKSEPNGIEVAKIIRKQPKHKSIPIVAVTAYAEKSSELYFLSHGFTHFLPKPFYKDKLFKLLDEIL